MCGICDVWLFDVMWMVLCEYFVFVDLVEFVYFDMLLLIVVG